jgi:WD40 repeat protein
VLNLAIPTIYAQARPLLSALGLSKPCHLFDWGLQHVEAMAGKWMPTAIHDKDPNCPCRYCHYYRVMANSPATSERRINVKVTPDGNLAVSGSKDKALNVWDLNSGVVRKLYGHSDYVCEVAVTPDGKRAVSASLDRTLKVWDLETGRALRTLVGHSLDVYGVAVTPDGKRVVSASRGHTLKVWDLESGRALRTLKGHSARVYHVAVTADGRRAVSICADHTLKLWKLDTGCALRTPEGFHHGVMTPDGKRVISQSEYYTLKVWDLETNRVLCTLKGHTWHISGVAVTADGKRAVALFLWHRALEIWDLDSGLLISTFHCDTPVPCGEMG